MNFIEENCLRKKDSWDNKNAMKHHLKGCLEDSSPDNIIINHRANNPKSDDNSEKVAIDIVNLGLSVKKGKDPGINFKFGYKK